MRSLLVVMLAACTAPSKPSVEHPAPSPVVASLPRPPAPSPHPELSQRRPYRNYYRVVSVAPYRHHFAAFFHSAELVTAQYEVDLAPGSPVHARGSSFGMITKRPAKTSVPTEVVAHARAVAADIEAREPDASNIDVHYLGAYRELVVEEIVGERMWKLTLAANEAFTQFGPPIRFRTNLGGTLRLDAHEEHADVPSWIDADLGRHGRSQLWTFSSRPTLFSAETRATFETATLAAARRLAANEPGLPLASLAIERDTRVLPEKLEHQRPFMFYVNAVAQGREQSSAQVWIDPLRAFGGEERMQLRLTISTSSGDARFDASVRMHGPAIPSDAAGIVELPLTLEYVITKDRVPVTNTVQATARVVVDGDRRYLVDVTAPIPTSKLPGTGQYSAFELHLGFMGEE